MLIEETVKLTMNVIKNELKTNECKDIGILKKIHPNLTILLGQKFNNLEVIEFSHYNKKNTKSYWKCRCECGREKVVGSDPLKRGGTKSCGCLRGKKNRGIYSSNFKDLSGQRNGKFQIIKLHPTDKGVFWLCRCDCGKEKILSTSRFNQTESCGCLQPEVNAYDLAGQEINGLRILKKNQIIEKTGKKRLKWLCLCLNCFNELVLETWTIINKLRHGCRQCYSQKFCGKNSPRWKGELKTEDRIKRRNLPELKQWRSKVYEKDNYTCAITGKKGGRLCAHHIESWDKNPALRFDVANGVTLSESIHKLFHKIYGRGNNTKHQFLEFISNFIDEKKQMPYYINNL